MKTLRYAFVGSREWPDDLVPLVKSTIKKALGSVESGSVIVSGGAPGVDSWAAAAAKDSGFEVDILEADWKRHGKAAGFIRNSEIVANSDIIVAFVLNNSSGTMDTVNKAKKAGKQVVLIRKNVV